MISSYKEITKLDNSMLDERLKMGDAQERIWAAWEIGLRKGSKVIPQLQEEIHKAPDPGTRRHMVIILAGFKDLDVLKVLAESDPNPMVRCEACRYLIKTDSMGNQSFITQRLELDAAPEIKEAILLSWDENYQPVATELLVTMLGDTSESVRRATLSHFARVEELSDSQIAAIQTCLFNEKKKNIIEDLIPITLKWRSISDLMRAASKEMKLKILDACREAKIRVEWSEVRELAAEHDVDLDIRVLPILAPIEGLEVLLWLGNGIARSLNPLPHSCFGNTAGMQAPYHQFRKAVFPLFLDLVKTISPLPVSESDVKNFSAIHQHLESSIKRVVPQENQIMVRDENDYAGWDKIDTCVADKSISGSNQVEDDTMSPNRAFQALLNRWIEPSASKIL